MLCPDTHVMTDVLDPANMTPSQQHVTEADLRNTFGFSAILCSSELGAAERNSLYARSYEAMNTLAKVCGLNPKWIGFASSQSKGLALSFSSNDAMKVSASYDPNQRVMHFNRGVSICAAHEWALALDNHLCSCTMAHAFSDWTPANGFISDRALLIDASKVRRPRLHAAVMSLYRELSARANNPMLRQAKQREKQKGERLLHWTSARQIWARSFESFIEDELAAGGQKQPWLASGTTALEQPDLKTSAYPLGDQRTRIRELWRELLDAMVSKA